MTIALYRRLRKRRGGRHAAHNSYKQPQTFNLVPIGARYNHESEHNDNDLDSNDKLTLALQRADGQSVYSSFLMAAYDEDRMEWQSVCWLDYGFTHDARMSASNELTVSSARVCPRENYHVDNTHANAISCAVQATDEHTSFNDTMNQCDVWFEPQHVWSITAECAYDTSSATCAYSKTGDSEKGISLRFPRFRSQLDSVEGEDDAKLRSCSSDELLRVYQRQ